jgi:CxxC-x17-CxxC domain-containing protein
VPAAPRLPSYEDPNAYRSPGFQDFSHNPYKIDYAGLPKDDEDPDGAQPQPGNARVDVAPRGMNGRRPDRAGTDPNAYRSPGFQNDPRNRRGGVAPKLPQADVAEELGEDLSQQPVARAESATHRERPAGSPSRRERRAQRPRFETTCNACGAAATVPFEPAPDRPAFCKPCYESKRDELGLGPGKRPVPTPST